MKVLVVGTGKMGYGVAWDLVHNAVVTQVGLLDLRQESLDVARQKLVSALEESEHAEMIEKLVLHRADVTNIPELAPLMAQYDVGVLTLGNRRCSYKAIEAAIEAGLDVVDILEEYHRRPDTDEIEGLEVPAGMTLDDYGDYLHARALERGVLILDGMGFAPGLSNVTTGAGIRRLDKAETAVARVGGIPSKEIANHHPLRYVITWAFSHVLREYMVKVKVRKGGEVVEVDATTEQERFAFNQLGQHEELVCAITPGMPSFIYSRPDLQEFAEKTVRWPGHWDGVRTLKECGLLDLDPVAFKGQQIVPREFLNTLLTPRLQPQNGEADDVCVMWNSVTGIKDGQSARVDYYMWEGADLWHGNTAMARVTAFPAAIAAVMVGQGMIPEKGIVPPEDAIFGERYRHFLAELLKRDITVLEVVTAG